LYQLQLRLNHVALGPIILALVMKGWSELRHEAPNLDGSGTMSGTWTNVLPSRLYRILDWQYRNSSDPICTTLISGFTGNR
jgi:hypothetical protein